MFSFLTENNIIQAGGIVIAILLGVVILFVVKMFLKTLRFLENENNKRQSEFNTALTNHLHDVHEDNLRKNKTDRELARVLGILCEKINNK